ncbi:MAG: hypothetical protein WDO24_13280 [Pseudomonadota bacterium]
MMALSDHVIVLDQGEKISEGATGRRGRRPAGSSPCYLGPEAVA